MSIKSKDEFYWSIFWPKSEYNLRKHALCSSKAGYSSPLGVLYAEKVKEKKKMRKREEGKIKGKS